MADVSDEEGGPKDARPHARTPSSSRHGARAGALRAEWDRALLLVVLYMLQGVPLGLCVGSVPFLMQSRLSYTAIGAFSVASYPYSFKLLWSPVVDSLHVRALGRRRSWILPLQTAAAALMLGGGGWAQAALDAGDAPRVTAYFFALVLLAATQDVAVDGWALTLLSPAAVGWAATCQTVVSSCCEPATRARGGGAAASPRAAHS